MNGIAVRAPQDSSSPYLLTDLGDLRFFEALTTPVWLISCSPQCVLYANSSARRLWHERVLIVPWTDETGPIFPLEEHDPAEETLSVVPLALADDLARGLALPGMGTKLHDSLTLLLPNTPPQPIDCVVTLLGLGPSAAPVALVEGTLRPVMSLAAAVSTQSAERALDATSLMVTLFHDTGQAVYQNASARAAFGDDIHGLPLFHARFANPHDAIDAWASVRQGQLYRAERPIRTARGLRWHALEIRLVADAASHCVLVTEQDITDHVQNQASLRETVERLARSNSELEQFAWITSHDLREPLRTVVSYITLLERHLGAELDDTGREFMAYAVSGAKRMDALTRDLLQYASIGRSPNPKQPISLQALLATLLTQRKADLEAAGAVVDCAGLPTIPGDLQEITLLFANLLDNAIKYRKPDEPLKISIIAEKEAQAWMIAVIDNGQGIDPRYFDRIFQIFQRLHTNETAVGTGVGLALCRKVVERHGGRIWVESAVGRGAAFFLTLPMASYL